jgi:hypothetical protein
MGQVLKMSSTLQLQPLAFDLVLPWNADKAREKALYGTLKKVLVAAILGFFFVQSLEFTHTPILSENAKSVEEKVLPQIPTPLATASTKVKSPKRVRQSPLSAKEASAVTQASNAETLETNVKTAIVKSHSLSEVSSQLASLRGAVDISKMQNSDVSDSAGGTVTTRDRELLGGESLRKKARSLVVDEAVMKGDPVNLTASLPTSIDDAPPTTEGNVPGDDSLNLLPASTEERDIESIRAALESVKSHAYTVYLRALADNPNLSGKSIFSIVIEPNGNISELKVVVNELQLPELEREILARIKQINFGRREAASTALEYKFVFLPS